VISWLLRRLAGNPIALFYRKELEAVFPQAFPRAEQEGLLRFHSVQTRGLYYDVQTNRAYELFDFDGRVVAYPVGDRTAPSREPSQAELARFAVNWDVLGASLQRHSELHGQVGWLDSRLFYLGMASAPSGTITGVVGRLATTPAALVVLRGIRSLLPIPTERIAVALPAVRLTLSEQRELSRDQIYVVRLSEEPTVGLEWSHLPTWASPKAAMARGTPLRVSRSGATSGVSDSGDARGASRVGRTRDRGPTSGPGGGGCGLGRVLGALRSPGARS
jgi:hypothetical protein